MKKLFTLIALFMPALLVFADVQVNGVVEDEKGEPVIGASIQVPGTSLGTISDYEGLFSISVPDDAKTLHITFVGMQPQDVAVKSNVRVVLKETSEVLQDVVVTGKEVVSKGSYGGSAQAVDAATIEKKSPTEISKALAGEVAGVQVVNTSGQPGTNATIRVRGIGSVNGSSAPLYVVDGIPYDGDVSSIDPGDIASTTILKGASAAALYGARAANGVILITTKRGTSGEDGKIDIDVNYGANMRILPLYDVITSPEEYVEMAWKSIYGYTKNETTTSKMLFSGAGIPAGYNIWNKEGKNLIIYDDPDNPKFDAAIGRKPGYENIESWKDETYRIGQRFNGSVKFSGGTEKTTYYTSIGYLKDEGYYQSSDYDRFNLRTNLDYSPKKWLKGNFNVTYAYTHFNAPVQDEDAMNNGFFYVNACPAIYPVYMRDENGDIPIDPRTGQKTYDYGNELFRSFGMGINPAGSLHLDKNNQAQHELDANGMLELKFGEMHNKLKGLKFSVNAGVHFFNNLSSELTNKYYGDAAGIGRIAQQSYNDFKVNASENISYDRTFGDHTISVLAGHESELRRYNYVLGYKSYLADGSSLELSNAIKVNEAEGNTTRFSTETYYAHASYAYDNNRYVVNAYYSAQGSSRYAKGHRWGHFGSFSVAWGFTEESFMKDQEWVKNGKLRLDWGILGNQIGSLYSYTDMYSIDNVNDEVAYIWGSKGNREITWERANMTDLGLELSLKDYLDFEFDYFYYLRDNLVFPRAVAPSLGYSSVPTNDAKMVNQGVEFSFKAHPVNERNVKLDLRLTGTHYRNYMTQMPVDYKDENGVDQRMLMNGAMSEGHSAYDHYTIEYRGLNDNGEQLFLAFYDASKGAFGQKLDNGEYNYITSLHQWALENPDKDVNDLAIEETTDYSMATSTYIPKHGSAADHRDPKSCLSYLPDLYGGFGVDLDVYGVTLSASCSYGIGGYGYDVVYMTLMDDKQVGSYNWHVDMRNAWTESNTNTDVPKLTNGLGEYASYANAGSTRFLTSNSYLSLNDVQIGYNFQKKLIEKIKLEKLHIYVSASNLAIASARRGYNPMASFTGNSDTHQYTPSSTIRGGIKLTF